MLRLAFWPTEHLWDEVSKIYQKFEESLPLKRKTKLRALKQSLSESQQIQTRQLRSGANCGTTNGVKRKLMEEEEGRADSEPFYQVGELLFELCGFTCGLHGKLVIWLSDLMVWKLDECCLNYVCLRLCCLFSHFEY